MSWTLTKKLDTFAGPGETKRKEVSWTLTKKLDTKIYGIMRRTKRSRKKCINTYNGQNRKVSSLKMVSGFRFQDSVS